MVEVVFFKKSFEHTGFQVCNDSELSKRNFNRSNLSVLPRNILDNAKKLSIGNNFLWLWVGRVRWYTEKVRKKVWFLIFKVGVFLDLTIIWEFEWFQKIQLSLWTEHHMKKIFPGQKVTHFLTDNKMHVETRNNTAEARQINADKKMRFWFKSSKRKYYKSVSLRIALCCPIVLYWLWDHNEHCEKKKKTDSNHDSSKDIWKPTLSWHLEYWNLMAFEYYHYNGKKSTPIDWKNKINTWNPVWFLKVKLQEQKMNFYLLYSANNFWRLKVLSEKQNTWFVFKFSNRNFIGSISYQ